VNGTASVQRSRARDRGFTYAELLIVVTVFGLMAGLAIKTVNLKSAQAELAARSFAADLVYARTEAIARPDLGCVIKINPTNHSYWIARPSTPDTPLTNSVTKKAYLVQLGSAAGSRYSDATMGSYSFGGDAVLSFDAFGALDQSSDATIAFTAGGETYTVTVSAATGIATVARTTVGVQVGGGGGLAEEF